MLNTVVRILRRTPPAATPPPLASLPDLRGTLPMDKIVSEAMAGLSGGSHHKGEPSLPKDKLWHTLKELLRLYGSDVLPHLMGNLHEETTIGDYSDYRHYGDISGALEIVNAHGFRDAMVVQLVKQVKEEGWSEKLITALCTSNNLAAAPILIGCLVSMDSSREHVRISGRPFTGINFALPILGKIATNSSKQLGELFLECPVDRPHKPGLYFEPDPLGQEVVGKEVQKTLAARAEIGEIEVAEFQRLLRSGALNLKAAEQVVSCVQDLPEQAAPKIAAGFITQQLLYRLEEGQPCPAEEFVQVVRALQSASQYVPKAKAALATIKSLSDEIAKHPEFVRAECLPRLIKPALKLHAEGRPFQVNEVPAVYDRFFRKVPSDKRDPHAAIEADGPFASKYVRFEIEERLTTPAHLTVT